jgi:hypothetical protein
MALFAALALVIALTAAASSERLIDFARASETQAAPSHAESAVVGAGAADSVGELQALMNLRVERGLADSSTEPSESLVPLAGIVLALLAVHVTLFGLLRRRSVAG